MKLDKLRTKLESFEEPIIKLLYKRSLYKQNLSNFESNYLSTKLLNKNSNDSIEFKEYINLVIIPLSENGEDSFLKETKRLDKKIIKLISKRINLGNKIVKLKLEDNYELFKELKNSNNIKKIENLITDKEIEKKIIERVSSKAILYFKDNSKKIESVKSIYKNIIGRTKEKQIENVLQEILLNK